MLAHPSYVMVNVSDIGTTHAELSSRGVVRSVVAVARCPHHRANCRAVPAFATVIVVVASLCW